MLLILFLFDKLFVFIFVIYGMGKVLLLLRIIFLWKVLCLFGRGGLFLFWVFFFLIVIFLFVWYIFIDWFWCLVFFGFVGRVFWIVVVEKGVVVLGVKMGIIIFFEVFVIDGWLRYFR